MSEPRWEPVITDDAPHVVPLYGRTHEAERTCWCTPRIVWQQGVAVWVHTPREVA